MAKKPDFTHCKALITGGSSGQQVGYARQLAPRGTALVIVSNEAVRIEEAAKELRDTYGVEVASLYMDLARPSAARELYEWCQAQHHEIDILINNAGIFFFKDVTDTDPARIETLVNLHVLTLTQMCRYFAADMCVRRKGWILNMSSMSCYTPNFGIALYAASKAYIRVFTRSIYWELHDYNVVATAVCPGGVATPLLGLSDKLLQLAVRVGAMMRPEDVVRKALKALFAGRKQTIPGWINYPALAAVMLLPPPIRLWAKRKFVK